MRQEVNKKWSVEIFAQLVEDKPGDTNNKNRIEPFVEELTALMYFEKECERCRIHILVSYQLNSSGTVTAKIHQLSIWKNLNIVFGILQIKHDTAS